MENNYKDLTRYIYQDLSWGRSDFDGKVIDNADNNEKYINDSLKNNENKL